MFRIDEEGIMQPEWRLVPVPVPSELFVQLYKKAKKDNSTIKDILVDIIQDYMNKHYIKE